MRRISALIIGLALVAVSCGGATVGGETSTTSTIAPTTTPVPSNSSTTSQVTTTLAPTTTTSGPTTTAPATPTTQPVVAPTEISVSPWFYVDEEGHRGRSGPFLIPLNRDIPQTRAIGRASLEQLFAGPTADERASTPAISTNIPNGVEVLGLTIREGIAIVDLSAEFDGRDETPVVAQRMAQVVFTLTSIPHVAEVMFRQEGKELAAMTSAGEMVSRPVSKADYLDFAAALTVETPVYGGTVQSPIQVTGFGAAFEAVFQYALTDRNGLIIAEGNAMTLNGTGWGGFDFSIPYSVSETQIGALIVWVNSAEDGSRIDIREYPIVLTK